ncbi:MAG: YgiQ family radical SAM protein [Clostridia bacterium]|nr:YgiQ family radical SAM protein [Clostridia bacterium]
MSGQFLPVTRQECIERGIKQLDFVYVIGDAYVDHSSFGPAIISRVLESHGYTVGIISQPDWKDERSIQALGEPRLAFLVSSGNMDSMVNHYTVSKKHRHKDSFSPGGIMGKRPDRAVVVYGNLIRKSYKHTPIILGGIEASLRRMGHYDYWSDQIKRSILLDSGADMISYGMGERSIVEIADALASGIDIKDLTFIRGTVYRSKTIEHIPEPIMLPAFSDIQENKLDYAKSFAVQYKNTDPYQAGTLVEDYQNQGYVVQNPPAYPLSMQEMDDVYDLPYMRTYHPMYKKEGEIPAIEEIRFSLTSNRGCFGSCSFCALTFHQGRIIQVRSHESLIKEASIMTQDAEFKGYIHDVGGPTADFRQPACQKQLTKGACSHRQCLYPTPCKNLVADHSDYLALLRKLRKLPKIKKVFIRSGIRFDYVLADKKTPFLKELAEYHVSGQLRVAPEHVSEKVLSKMGKPSHQVYMEFLKKYEECCKKSGKEQYAVPYFMSSHPGCGIREAIELAEYIRDMGFMPEQVQDFYPTPSTIATCMYYTQVDPVTMESVYVPKNPHEKAMQRALIQYRNPENRQLVIEALKKGNREDLIGFGPKCLIRPRRTGSEKSERFSNDNKNIKAKKKKSIRNVHRKKQ